MNVNGVGPGVMPVSPATSGTNSAGTAARDAAAIQSVSSVPSNNTAVGSGGSEAYSVEHVQQVVKKANALLDEMKSSMRLETKLEDNQAQVNLVDKKTGQAIRTFPASGFVQIVQREFIGLLMDNYA